MSASKAKEKPLSPHHHQLTHLIHIHLTDIFRHLGLSSFRQSLVTLTEVELSADKRVCKIYFSVIDETLFDALSLEIEARRADFQKMLAQKLKNKMRFVPSEYFFYPDKTAAQASKVLQLIDSLSKPS